jgi:hypothetical protein
MAAMMMLLQNCTIYSINLEEKLSLEQLKAKYAESMKRSCCRSKSEGPWVCLDIVIQ